MCDTLGVNHLFMTKGVKFKNMFSETGQLILGVLFLVRYKYVKHFPRKI